MASLEIPHAVRAEIIDILQSLRRSWPHWKSLNYPNGDQKRREHVAIGAYVEPFIGAIQWLTDRGFITFEALIVDSPGLTLMDAALTSRGRDFISTHMPADAGDRPGQ